MFEFIQKIPIETIITRCLAVALVLTVTICLIDFYRRPWHIARRVYRILHRSHARNKLGEYPTLRHVRKNPNKKHELLLELDSKGLAPPDFDKHLDRWKVGLNGMVRIDFGVKANRIWIYYLPRKYVRPTLISPKDNAIGAISLEQLINLLVIGPTGAGKTVTIKILMAKASRLDNSTIWLLDFKKLDFQKFKNFTRYYSYTDCLQGLKDYYAALLGIISKM